MKTIFITISRGALIRNFFHTGVISHLLDKGMRVVVLTPHYNDLDLFAEYKHDNLHLEPLHIFQKTRFRRILMELFKGAVFNETVHARYKYRISGRKPSKLLYIPRLVLFAPLRFIPGSRFLIRFADGIINPNTRHDYLFEKYKPDLVFNTTAGGDCGVLKSAKRFRVKTVDMPKSWDNLSKFLFNIKADYLIVWSDFMRKQAVRFQGYKEKEIFVTGVPQFDFYKRKDLLVSREEFCKQFGFDPQKKIVLYGSAGANLCNEPPYIEITKQAVNEGILPKAQILVRPHLGYKDDAKRFMHLEQLNGIVVDKNDKQNYAFKDKWDPSWGHIKNLYNSMHHADVCINLASTLILDATACGTPVINIAFDLDKNVSKTSMSAGRLYKDDYIKSVLAENGLWFVKSKKAYLDALQEILTEGRNKKEGMKNIIDRFVYKNDGKSSERLANTLIMLANQVKN